MRGEIGSLAHELLADPANGDYVANNLTGVQSLNGSYPLDYPGQKQNTS